MIVPADIQRKHEIVRPYVQEAATRVKDIVGAYCEQTGFAYVGRIKAQESLAEKIETGRFSSWSMLDDLFACCIVIPTLGDEAAVLDFLRSEFVEVACRQRASSSKDPAVFRFDATRFIGRLSGDRLPMVSHDILEVSFEIQTRTAFEHAWSVTTHALAYKSGIVDWRHDRLAAQLKAAVEQLDQVVLGFEQSAQFISEQRWPAVQSKRYIQEFFARAIQQYSIPSEVIPASWGRFCDNLTNLIVAHHRPPPANQTETVAKAVEFIEIEIRSIAATEFPRSISLFQFCVGALCKSGFLRGQASRFTPLLTPELLGLYPESRRLGTGFDFEF
jgi:ppGpp synthetase/RelA/SpoT-type nucleotidyltranferase